MISSKNLPWIVTVVAVVVLGGILVAQRAAQGSHHPRPRPGITAANVLPASHFAGYERLVGAYTAARAVPQVLDGIYCHCRCKESIGHVSLLTCFETEHGAQCDICLGEAELAAQMHGQGAALEAIRRAIDQQYGRL